MRFPSRVRMVLLALLVAGGSVATPAALTGVLSSAACTDTTTVNASLVSGIFIKTDLLINGYGCGVADSGDDVYKYVAVVIDQTRTVGGAGVFDCFADGVFANLPGTDAGQLNFDIWIYAYNKAAFDAANQNNALTNAVNTLNGVNQADGSVIPVPISVVPLGGTTKRGFPAALSEICLTPATWTSSCTATSQPGVQFEANCQMLELQEKAANSCNIKTVFPDAGND